MNNFFDEYVTKYNNMQCECKKTHLTPVSDIIVEKGAINRLPELLKKGGFNKPFIVADKNTFKAAGDAVCKILTQNGTKFSKHVFKADTLEPDEFAVGSLAMHYDNTCDVILGVGSGVINDTSKILANITNKKYIIVATAPSMDGYASATSSVAMDGLKFSLNSKAPDIIVGDIDILKDAPLHLLKSGLGDMLAKYISICEWKLAKLIIGEYYCQTVADLVNTALKKCVDNAKGLLNRDEDAVKAVFEGLVIGGLAMSYAGISRPASGMEHYISHVWDMRGLAFGTPVDTHGVQCAIGTLYTAKLYEKLKGFVPNKQKALDYVSEFDVNKWYEQLKEFMGSGADTMIELDKKEQKYDKQKHAERLDFIISHWDEIQRIIAELPSAEFIENILDEIESPDSCEKIGLSKDILPMTVKTAKDIRDKYVLSKLLWDLGVLDEFANSL